MYKVELMFYLVFSLLITAFGQPSWGLGLGLLSSTVGFALFWKGMYLFPRNRDRFLAATFWFASVQGIQLSWLTTIDYMGPLILVVYLFLILGMGVQFGILSFWITPLISWHQVFAVAGFWTVFEWMRLFFLCGFTWNPVGLALAGSIYSLQWASVWGIFGLSFWVIFTNLAAFKAWAERSRKVAVVWVAIAAFPYLFGAVHLFWLREGMKPDCVLKVALVQTNLLPEQKEYFSDNPHAYIDPIAQWEGIVNVLPKEPLDLIVLPEAALPFGAHLLSYPLSSALSCVGGASSPPLNLPFAIFERGSWKVGNPFLLQSLANERKTHIITGLDDRDLSGKYNAAFHFSPNNLPYERYEKQILVPVGEYVPLKKWRRFAQFIGEQFGIYSSFDPGVESKIFHAGVPIGISICLEETFSNLIRKLRLKGAKLFVNVTNDAWFPGSRLPDQHFDHGRIRAVENGVCILRACNGGISGVIDCFGQPLKSLSADKKEVSSLFFSLPVCSYPTLYTVWGDGAILAISSLSICSYLLFRKKKLL